MYKNYIFDFYGTLVDILTDETEDSFWESMARFFSYNGAFYESEELRQAYLTTVSEFLEKTGKYTKHPDIKIQDAFKELYQRKGLSIKPEEENLLLAITARVFRNISTKHIKLYDGVIDTFEMLKRSGKRIFLLSNGQREFTVPELKSMGIYNYFDRICSSSDLGISKPDEAFFQYLIKTENLNIKESIMIGNDHTSDIEGARRIGMDSLYIHTQTSRKINPKEVDSTYTVGDGDFSRIKQLIFRS